MSKAVEGSGHSGGRQWTGRWSRKGSGTEVGLELQHQRDSATAWGCGDGRAHSIPLATARRRDRRDGIAGGLDRVAASLWFRTGAVRAAKVEAQCTPNGVGIVKLMGRSAGMPTALKR